MYKPVLKAISACGFAVLAVPSYADQGGGGKEATPGSMKMEQLKGRVARSIALSDGVVEDVDKESKSVTLKHGPIKSETIEMGPMTMPFSVKDISMLSDVKVGDNVKFTAQFIDNEATITSLVVRK